MEPDPVKNIEKSGFSKRRISSILKAPRKSARCPEQEQQENVVECAKPGEKRNSRRVSFAPANDVLLFSKDAKNTSPGRNPFQDLTATTACPTLNRGQTGVNGDGGQKIAGMESLLNAPLHDYQLKDKVNFDTGNDFGERTFMFSAHEASMDMTQSHTINIASDADVLEDGSFQNNVLPTALDKKSIFPVNSLSASVAGGSLFPGRKLDFSVDKKNVSASLQLLDPESEKFLASLSEPAGPGVDSAITRATPPLGPSSEDKNRPVTQTRRLDVDKENQAPPFVPAAIGKPLHNASKSGLLLATLCPEDEATEAQRGDDDVDPFQWLFPSQDMYARSDRRASHTSDNTKASQQQQNSKSVGLSDSSAKSLQDTPQAQHKVSIDSKEESREKTVQFTADDMFMDLTQSHTVHIDRGSAAAEPMSADTGNPGLKNVPVSHSSEPASIPVTTRATPTAAPSFSEAVNTNGSLSLPTTLKVHADKENEPLNQSRSFGRSFSGSTTPPKDAGTNMTELQGRSVLGGEVSMDLTEAQIDSSIPDTVAHLQHTFSTGAMPSKNGDLKDALTPDQQRRETIGLPDCKGVEIPYKTSLKTIKIQEVNCDADFDSKEKTVRFTAEDACMDLTQSHTVNIHRLGHQQSRLNEITLPVYGEKTVRFCADDAAMDLTQSCTVNIAIDIEKKSQNVEFLPASGEKTVRFTIDDDDAAMDITKSQTVNLSYICDMQSHQKAEFDSTSGEKSVSLANDRAAMDEERSHLVDVDFRRRSQSVDHLQSSGEKTVRFSADDATVDMTKSHTVNIVADYNWQSQQNVPFVSTREEIPARLTTDDAAEDETSSHVVDITTDFKRQSQNVDLLRNSGEKTVRFTADDAAMDVTKSHTVNIDSSFQPWLQNVDPLPVFKEKTAGLSACDTGMDMTQCLTANIASNSSFDAFPPHQNVSHMHENVNIPSTVKKEESVTGVPHTDRSVCVSEGGSSKAEATDEPFTQESTDTKDSQSQMAKPDVTAELERPAFCAGVMEKSVTEILTDCPNISENMDLTEAQTGCIMEQTFTNESPQCVPLTQNKEFEHPETIQTSLIRSEAPGPPCSDNVAIANPPGSPDSSEKETLRESDPCSRTCPIIQNIGSSPSTVSQDADIANSRKSRRRSLAELRSKVRCLNTMINTSPEPVATDGCPVPLPSLLQGQDKNPEDGFPSGTVEPELNRAQTEDIAQDQCLGTAEDDSASTATAAFSLKTKRLMSRLSVGGFKPKLPRRSKPDDSNQGKLAEERPKTVEANVPNRLSNFDNDVSDIFDEELGSYEDISETLDEDIEKASERKRSIEEFDFRKTSLEDDVFVEDFMSPAQRQKRPFPEDGNMDNEKRMRTSSDPTEESDAVDCDSVVITAPTIRTQTSESSICSHTASMRCEATFESTYKQSMLESQFEDYASDVQMKLEDGSITVLEFFKLFNIDFVIHNPRQSVCPGRILSENEVTAMDLLKNRHISHPKQMVYETDVRNLTDQVERLKVRMEDLDKPLKAVNNPLWEEMRRCSDKELRSFGIKLKERNNFFRKTSKVQSHEMKEVLYFKLLHALKEEQQNLKGTIEKADEMLKSLDDCIHELQTELAGVEENGFDGKPGMKSLQEEMEKTSETMDNNERQICELELQKKQNSSKLKRLNAEIQSLQSHMDMLDILNEWKLKENRDDGAVYTFLHETMNLQLTFEKSDGNLADSESERKVTQIRFNFELDDETSQCHARLVHKLVSQFVEAEPAWVEKFPTTRHVPKLLHAVSLVVSRCRLLGEECQRLRLWGSLPFDILHLSCSDTRISVVFSSLRKCSKFEVVFAVSLSNRLCVLQVESFKNRIGSTTMGQIEKIVSSFTPTKNLLTKIVKKIHDTLLC